MLELIDREHSMTKVSVGAIFISDIVGSPMGIIYFHCTYNRHQYVFGKRTTHQKGNIEEDIYWYTQHQTEAQNMTNILHCKSCPQFLQINSPPSFLPCFVTTRDDVDS